MRKAQWFAGALALALGVSMASVAHAAKYGTAGCGLGSMLFNDDKGLIQVLAATTNGTFYSQTFGITTGTSNCEDTAGGEESAKAFIETNREAFAKDVARGSGETITTLTTLSGCADSAAVGAALQRNFSAIFPSSTAKDTQVSKSAVDTLRGRPELSCRLLG
jgi:hypothetical protein